MSVDWRRMARFVQPRGGRKRYFFHQRFVMGDAAHRFCSPRLSRAVVLAALAASTSCGDSGSTDPAPIVKTPAPATAIALVTPFDAASPFTRRANDSLPSALAVQLRDATGQAVRQAGRTVTLTVSEPGGAPTSRIQIRRGGSAVTDTAGIARLTELVLSGRVGDAELSAKVDSLPALSIPMRLGVGALSTTASAVTVAPDTVPVGGVAQVVVMPMDASGNKRGANEQVTAALDGDQTLATVSAFTWTPADSSYRGSITVVTPSPARPLRVTVNGSALGLTPSFTGIAAPPPPANPATALRFATLPGDTTPSFNAVSASIWPATSVQLVDASGASVRQSGVAITARVTNPAGQALPGATLSGAGPVSTDASGVAAFPALSLSSPAGLARVRFEAGNLTAVSLPVLVSPAVVTASSPVSLTPDTIAVAGVAQLVATPRDAGGRKLGAGQTVVVSVAGGTSVVTVGAVAFSAGDSSYRASLTGVTAGTATTVTTTVNGVTLSTTRPLTVRSAGGVPGAADISGTVNGSNTFEISRFIYGGNFLDDFSSWGNSTPPAEMTLNRMGGNRLSAYNWENNYSNAGNDYFYNNDQFLSGSATAGQAVKTRATAAFGRGQAFMATVPMIGYVAGDACGCNVGITDADRANRLATRFRVSKAVKGSAFSLTPSTGDGFVYQDEFVNWFESNFPGRTTNSTAPVFFSLDNEPDIWHTTHQEINSNIGDNSSTPRIQTYTGFTDTSVVYAKAVKNVLPNAMIFGPATATYAGLATLGRYPTPDPVYGSQNFFDVYLDRMRAASTAEGRRLLDVLDLHFYSEATPGSGTVSDDYSTQSAAMIEARLQAPRSLWDPTYTENSWVSGVTGGPIRLIPRLREQIAAHYPGTKLAITEYYYGRGGDISGGIAQADVLGIFGREGLFAATIWPLGRTDASGYNGSGTLTYQYMYGAFKMYRNYDGAGGAFGVTGLQATTSDVAASSIYASRTTSGKTVLVVINKTSAAKVTRITLSNVGSPTGAQVYLMQNGTPNPARQADVVVSAGVLTYTMPALSVSTLVLTP